MNFEPFRDGHAISEVVFGIVFNRPFSSEEFMAFGNSHSVFIEKLPGRSQIAAFPMALGGQPMLIQGPGVAFDRYDRAGAVEQRLRLEGNAVFVNTLQYSRWAEVSSEAFQLLEQSILATIKSPISISGLVLQYIDMFTWKSETSKYELSQLLVKEGSYFPESIFDNGHLWHLHQGWYKKEGLPEKGRLLERITTDGIENLNSEPIVRLDCYLGFEFENQWEFNSLDKRPVNGSSGVDLFSFMHDENKQIMGNCLTSAMKGRIGL